MICLTWLCLMIMTSLNWEAEIKGYRFSIHTDPCLDLSCLVNQNTGFWCLGHFPVNINLTWLLQVYLCQCVHACTINTCSVPRRSRLLLEQVHFVIYSFIPPPPFIQKSWDFYICKSLYVRPTLNLCTKYFLQMNYVWHNNHLQVVNL